MRHGLFEVNILPLVHGFDCDLGMPVIGSCHNDAIDVRPRQDLAIVQVPISFADFLRSFLALLVDIRNRQHLHGS